MGDLHGCADEFDDLLKAFGHGPGDRVVLVGDLVAKGPDSAGVLARARELGALSVRGNHDHALLRLHHASGSGEPAPRVKQTHLDAAAALAAADWEYLEAMPLHLSLPELGALVVHGGLVPGVPLAEQLEQDLMSMRALTPAGRGSRHHRDGRLWATCWRGPEHVYFGHDAIVGLQSHTWATGLDTGCVYGRRLTGCVLPEGRLLSVPARRRYAEAGS